MVSIRFTSLVFVLMFILLRGKGSNAQTPQDGNEPVVAEGITVTVEKEILNGAPAAAEVTKIRVGGRKMILKRALGEEIVKEESVDEESQKITGANHSVGIGNQKGKSMLNVACKLSTKRSLHPVKIKMGGFIAFSADYHVPKSHPPKNN